MHRPLYWRQEIERCSNKLRRPKDLPLQSSYRRNCAKSADILTISSPVVLVKYRIVVSGIHRRDSGVRYRQLPQYLRSLFITGRD
ncbi:hypothetical protein D3C87_1947960 [compost metagenome]